MEKLYPYISQYFLEGTLLGEIDPDELVRIRLLAGDTPLMDMLDSLKDSNMEILRWYPPEQVTTEILRRFRAGAWMRQVRWARWLRESPGTRLRSAIVVPILGMSLFVALSMLSRRPQFGAAAGGSEAVAAGLGWDSGGISLFRRTAEGAERLSPGQVVSEGDQVQLQLRVPHGSFAMVLSLDGSGRVSRHWPILGDSASAVPAGAKFLLPQSFQLDRAPGFERFFLVTSPERFPLEEVALEAERLGRNPRLGGCRPLQLGEGYLQLSFLLRKKDAS